MTYGYHGKMLRVNVTVGELCDEPLPERLALWYLGGSGLAARHLYDETDASRGYGAVSIVVSKLLFTSASYNWG